MRKYSKKAQKLKIKRLFFVFLIFLIGLILMLDCGMRPMIKKIAEARASTIATTVINDAVSGLIAKEKITYNSLVSLKFDKDSQVTAMESNISSINKLKSDIGIAINNAMVKCEATEVSIPAGSLTGNEFLIGRGPRIPIKFTLASVINSTLTNEFTDAGINQTCVRIMLQIDANIYVLIPWYNTATKVTTNICIAETIIVGKVPSSYTNLELSKSTAPEIIGGSVIGKEIKK